MAFPKGDCRPSTIAGQSVNDSKTMFTGKKKLQSTLSYKSLGEQNILFELANVPCFGRYLLGFQAVQTPKIKCFQ